LNRSIRNESPGRTKNSHPSPAPSQLIGTRRSASKANSLHWNVGSKRSIAFEKELQEARATEKILSSRYAEIAKERTDLEDQLALLGMRVYSKEAHEAARREVDALEKQQERLRELQFHRESLTTLVQERDGLLEAMEKEMATFHSFTERSSPSATIRLSRRSSRRRDDRSSLRETRRSS